MACNVPYTITSIAVKGNPVSGRSQCLVSAANHKTTACNRLHCWTALQVMLHRHTQTMQESNQGISTVK